MFRNWTWQQKKKFKSFLRLKYLFINSETNKPEPRTWAELSEGMPKGTLSPLLRKWIKNGFVEVRLRIHENGKRETVYTLKKPVFKLVHKSRKTGAIERIFVSPEGEIKRDYGELVRSGKSKIRYFRKAKKAK